MENVGAALPSRASRSPIANAAFHVQATRANLVEAILS
jgi:hypothetical protein